MKSANRLTLLFLAFQLMGCASIPSADIQPHRELANESSLEGILTNPSLLKISAYRSIMIVKYGTKTARLELCNAYTNNYSDVQDIANIANGIVMEAAKQQIQKPEVAILFNPFNAEHYACDDDKKYSTASALFKIKN